MLKIMLSPENRGDGHGAYIGHPNVFERDVCHEIADFMQPILEAHGIETVIAEYGTSMYDRVPWANANRVDYYMCIHTNAALTPGAGTGCECLYYNHPQSIRANQLAYDELTKLYPSKRGLKDYSGFYENANTTMVSCYPEIAFHDNERDVEFILSNKQAIAEALCKAVCAFFGVAYAPPVTPTEELPDTTEADALRDEIRALQEENEELSNMFDSAEEEIKQLTDDLEARHEEILIREQQTGEVQVRLERVRELAREMLAV